MCIRDRFCGMCGAMMFGECGTGRNKVVHHYYKCATAKRFKTCKKKTVRKEWLEEMCIRDRVILTLGALAVSADFRRAVYTMIQKFLPIEMQLTYQMDGEPLEQLPNGYSIKTVFTRRSHRKRKRSTTPS